MLVDSVEGAAWQARLEGGCSGLANTSAARTKNKGKHRALQISDGCTVRNAGDALCWKTLTGKPCECDGVKLHLAGHCLSTISYLLGQASSPCTLADCTELHPDPQVFLERLLDWWGPDWKFQEEEQETADVPALQCVPASTWPVSDEPTACVYQTVDFWAAEVAAKQPLNEYLALMVQQQWFASMLQAPGAAKMWKSNRKPLLKELSESYAVLERVKQQLSDGSDGGDLVLFDVCSGKGIAALMLSFALPGAIVVMVDANTEMDLSHLAGPMTAGQLRFYNLDIFTPQLPQLVRQHVIEGRKAVMVGTHLCGSLSPRLISVFRDCGEVDVVLLSPCCLKGWLGKQVQNNAAQQQRVHYEVLCEELAAMLQPEQVVSGPNTCVKTWIEFDVNVLSPKNGFILSKRP